MSIPSRSKKLIVLCDGTWCGRETGTVTNISLLATAIGLPDSTAPTDTNARTYVDPARKLKACYFPGQGLGGTFLEYLFNGETGSDIGAECMRVYQYIVENYDTDTEIWMFGLSRGCYTLQMRRRHDQQLRNRQTASVRGGDERSRGRSVRHLPIALPGRQPDLQEEHPVQIDGQLQRRLANQVHGHHRHRRLPRHPDAGRWCRLRLARVQRPEHQLRGAKGLPRAQHPRPAVDV